MFQPAKANDVCREWHRLLEEDGVKVFAISPGHLATGLGGSQQVNKSNGAGDPAVAGVFVRDVLQGKRDSDAGKVVNGGSVQAW